MQKDINLPKIQHYVPRFLLKNFAKGKRPHIWVYDKKDERSFRANIKKIAAENAFYNLEIDQNVIHSLEPSLANLEEKCAKLIKNIINTESIEWLSSEERELLSVFIIIQKMRTPHFRDSILHIDKALQEMLSASGFDPKDVENYQPIDKESARHLSLSMLTEANKTAPHIYEKEWLLFKGKQENPFYISDNPIALQNMKDLGPRGTLGLAVEGIEIYMPLSSTLTLAMHCSTTVKELREKYSRVSTLIPILMNSEESKFSGLPYLEKIMTGFNKGIAVECSDDGILNLNYLQVYFAERQIFCEKDKFWLVTDILKENSGYKIGPRIKYN